MTTNYPLELQQAIIARSGAHSVLTKSLVQGKRKMNKAKQRCGIPIDDEYDQVAVTYYLLRPQKSPLEPEPLKLGELIITRGGRRVGI